MLEMAGVLELTGDAGDIVVADEGHRDEAIKEFVMSRQGMVQLMKIAVVEAAPDRLPQFVLRDRVEAGVGELAPSSRRG